MLQVLGAGTSGITVIKGFIPFQKFPISDIFRRQCIGPRLPTQIAMTTHGRRHGFESGGTILRAYKAATCQNCLHYILTNEFACVYVVD